MVAKVKTYVYLEACLARRRGFMPLVYSVDGMACKEAKAYEKRIVSLIAKKWDRPYIAMVGYVSLRMGMAVIRSTTMMLRGARSNKQDAPELEDVAAYKAVRERCIEW